MNLNSETEFSLNFKSDTHCTAGQWDVTHATSRTAPSRWIQKISHEHGLQFLQHFNINYKWALTFWFFYGFLSESFIIHDLFKGHRAVRSVFCQQWGRFGQLAGYHEEYPA